jgi:hypothetical protein
VLLTAVPRAVDLSSIASQKRLESSPNIPQYVTQPQHDQHSWVPGPAHNPSGSSKTQHTSLTVVGSVSERNMFAWNEANVLCKANLNSPGSTGEFGPPLGSHDHTVMLSAQQANAYTGAKASYVALSAVTVLALVSGGRAEGAVPPVHGVVSPIC